RVTTSGGCGSESCHARHEACRGSRRSHHAAPTGPRAGCPQPAAGQSFPGRGTVIRLIVFVASVETVENPHRCRSDLVSRSSGPVEERCANYKVAVHGTLWFAVGHKISTRRPEGRGSAPHGSPQVGR